MTNPNQGKAPLAQRLAVWFFSILFGLLVFWLTGFLMRDIRTWPGPVYETFEETMLDPALIQRKNALDAKIADIERAIDNAQQRRGILGSSTSATRETMNQLIEFRLITIENSADLDDKEEAALADAIDLFITNQREYQQLSGKIAELNGQLQKLKEDRRELEETLDEKRAPIHAAYQEALEQHRLIMAAIELVVLVPFAVIACFLFLRGRGGIYKPLIHAFGLAVLVRVGLVLHEYFPSRYFKYIVILVAIVIVVWILIHLLRMIAFPKKDFLLKRYREAYVRFACPICDYPIRRGPMRFAYWTKRTLKKLGNLGEESEPADEPYVCPACATQLFEECPNCHAVRHSLLPACEHCGHQPGVGTRDES